MKWSWRIGRIAGIDVNLHATFLILLGWVAISHFLDRLSVGDTVSGLLFMATLFVIVVLHELGHALAARRFGIRTRDITLLPIGGVARLERMPEDPRQELLVSLAGPAVNVLLAVGLAMLLVSMPRSGSLDELRLVGGPFLVKLLAVNIGLALFNLIPAFPMDGGRVLRALLAMKIEYVKATNIAASIGQGLALLLGFVGLFTNPFWVFVALFVWMGAAGEASMVQMRSALGGIPIIRAMITDFRTLSPADPLQQAVDHVLAGFQQDFPVVDRGRLVGVLTRADMLAVLARKGQTALVGDAMRSDFETAEPAEMLDNVMSRLQSCECHALPVVQDGQLVGMLTMDNVGEFMMIQSALRRKASPSDVPPRLR